MQWLASAVARRSLPAWRRSVEVGRGVGATLAPPPLQPLRSTTASPLHVRRSVSCCRAAAATAAHTASHVRLSSRVLHSSGRASSSASGHSPHRDVERIDPESATLDAESATRTEGTDEADTHTGALAEMETDATDGMDGMEPEMETDATHAMESSTPIEPSTSIDASSRLPLAPSASPPPDSFWTSLPVSGEASSALAARARRDPETAGGGIWHDESAIRSRVNSLQQIVGGSRHLDRILRLWPAAVSICI